MPHVSVHYKIYLTEGHHRQPRNANSELEPNPPSETDVNNSCKHYSALCFTAALHLRWQPGAGANDVLERHRRCTVRRSTAGPLTQAVGASPLTITAWYIPVGGDGNGGPGIISTLSRRKRLFIDDTFVTVTSDPSLTSEANVVGIVLTTQT